MSKSRKAKVKINPDKLKDRIVADSKAGFDGNEGAGVPNPGFGGIPSSPTTDCMCILCEERRRENMSWDEIMARPIRFACEICGNKRCPHHTNHELTCTNSNETGQEGSIYQ